MEFGDLYGLLWEHYGLKAEDFALLRDSGTTSYAFSAEGSRYFLRVTKPAFAKTAMDGIKVWQYLQGQGYPVIPLLPTKGGKGFVSIGAEDKLQALTLSPFVEGDEPPVEKDAEALGRLVGRFHRIMAAYPHPLVSQDKHFYITRYLEILERKQYPRVKEFAEIGNTLWGRIKDLPQGVCHGDLYRGNMHKTPTGACYMLDFDTCCVGFPVHDIALLCNGTDYFQFEENGFTRTLQNLTLFLKGYRQEQPLSPREAAAVFDMLAVYHFQLQATLIEVFGLDFSDEAFFDQQLDWLKCWEVQCTQYAHTVLREVKEWNT